MLRSVATTSLSLLLLGAALPARADLGGSLSLQSDARDRGLSYSDDKPQAQLALDYDGTEGWYGGGLLTRARFDAWRASDLLQAYAGRVMTLASGLDVEAGLQYSHFASISRYDFAEPYVGLLGTRWNARLHYANDYYGSGRHTAYAEFNMNWPLHPTLQAVAHAGALIGMNGGGGDHRARYDARLGLAWQLRPIELQLAWVAVSPGGPYAWVDEHHRQTVVLGVSASF